MIRQYGWTLDYVDSLGPDERARVRDMWLLRGLHAEADAFLADWGRKQADAAEGVRRLRDGA